MLNQIISDWRNWVKEAEKYNDGWQSYFPEWESLIREACKVLSQEELKREDLENLEFVFNISNEDEELVQYGKENFQTVKENLVRLLQSEDYEVRWQIYETFKAGDESTDKVLLEHLKVEKDDYALRRLILTIINREVSDYKVVLYPFLKHEDTYIRRIVSEALA